MKDWFCSVRDEYSRIFLPFAGLPLLYVEIGVWKGDSAAFACEHLLTHPQSHGYGIDPYEVDHKRSAAEIDTIKEAARDRLAPYVRAGQWAWRFGKSQDVLRQWSEGTIDLLYIDGSHNAQDVLCDFCYAWPHLRKGSVVLFDDYGIGQRQTKADGMPRVPVAVDAILRAFALFVRPIPTGGARQFAVQIARQPVVGELLEETRRRGAAVSLSGMNFTGDGVTGVLESATGGSVADVDDDGPGAIQAAIVPREK